MILFKKAVFVIMQSFAMAQRKRKNIAKLQTKYLSKLPLTKESILDKSCIFCHRAGQSSVNGAEGFEKTVNF